MLSNVEERNYVRTQKNSGNTLHTGNANTTERSLLNILQHCEDLSIGSEEVEKKITDWSSRYYLSSKRVDILRPFTQHLRRKKILEIGGRSGTVTRFLGELECYVLSFEENADWIKVERERCRDLQNIKLVNDRIENCAADERFDFVILLETAELHNLGAADRLIRFNKIKNLLSPQGKLLLAIENKIGLKYWAGAPEIQGRAQYQTLQHPEAGENTTFSYHEMVSLLRESGFEIFQRMYPFPDHLFSDVIITDTGFKTKGFDPLELLFEKFEYFQHAKYNGQFSTTLAGATLFENDLLPQFANSFLLTAGLSPGSDAVEQNEILAYVYTTSRKKEYCKQTFFQCNPTTNEISVVRQSLYKQNTQNSHLLHQSLHQEPYMRGSVLLGSLLPVVSSAGWTIEDLVEWANRFNEIIL